MVVFLILKQRYKEFSVTIYYIFFVSLFVARIIQTCFSFDWINNRRIKTAIVGADSFSVCIGLSQVMLIADLIITMQYFEALNRIQDRDTISDQSD